jgi:hypothetical protein
MAAGYYSPMADTPQKTPQGFDVQEELRRLREDRHLNLFYCYGAKERDEEKNVLVENNLTRALVHTIRMLSDAKRHELLHALFCRDRVLEQLDFRQAEVALQGNSPGEKTKLGKKYGVKRIVTIATSTQDPGDCVRREKEPEERLPDAWIFHQGKCQYCLLLECKTKKLSLSLDQIRGHAAWFGEQEAERWSELGWDQMQEELELRLLPLTWYDVLEAIGDTLPELSARTRNTSKTDREPDDHEKVVLTHLWEFLGHYRYELLGPFRFEGLAKELPEWQLCRFELRRCSK